MVAGVSLEAVELEGSCKAREEGEGRGGVGVGGGSVTGWLEREVYSCERLDHIRGGKTALTAALPVLHFDFTNPEVHI